MQKDNIEILDEALRILSLEMAADDVTADKELAFILSNNAVVEMPFTQKGKLFAALNTLVTAPSLGQVIRERMSQMHITPLELSENAKLPAHVIEGLVSDELYPNNVPIVLFKNLLNHLSIKFTIAEKSIRKTFESLQSMALNHDANIGLTPSFRSSLYLSKSVPHSSKKSTDSKELFENKEAMEKYLNRLNQLLND